MTDDQKQVLLDELVRYGTRPQMQPGDVTLAELADAMGVSRATAQKRVEPLVGSGELLELTVTLPSGHDGIVYRRA
jgi:DNA-binding Lrp family transcriptional regulator